MQWVADTGPVLHLVEAEAFDLLRLLGDVVVPVAVVEELVQWRSNWTGPAWLHVASLEEEHKIEAEDWRRAGFLDRGEAHAIALARQIHADFFLTDDAAARLFASTLGLHVHGSLGVILWLAGQRRIELAAAAKHLDRLAATSLWISSRILTEAHAALAKISAL